MPRRSRRSDSSRPTRVWLRPWPRASLSPIGFSDGHRRRAAAPSAYFSEGGSFSGLYPADTTFQSFVVKAAVLPAAPRIDGVVNAASQLGVALSPGAVFQVQGAAFVADATLLVDDIPLPLLSQTPNVLTAMLPSDFV